MLRVVGIQGMLDNSHEIGGHWLALWDRRTLMALNAPEKTLKLEAVHQGVGETLIDVQGPYRREINLY